MTYFSVLVYILKDSPVHKFIIRRGYFHDYAIIILLFYPNTQLVLNKVQEQEIAWRRSEDHRGVSISTASASRKSKMQSVAAAAAFGDQTVVMRGICCT